MNKQEFADIIFGDDPAKRKKWFDLLAEPVFLPKYNMSLNDIREDAYKKLKRVTDAKMLSV
jgi:ribosomal protein S3AE